VLPISLTFPLPLLSSHPSSLLACCFFVLRRWERLFVCVNVHLVLLQGPSSSPPPKSKRPTDEEVDAADCAKAASATKADYSAQLLAQEAKEEKWQEACYFADMMNNGQGYMRQQKGREHVLGAFCICPGRKSQKFRSQNVQAEALWN